MRVLDIDLDFFVHGVAYYMESAGPRLPDEDSRVEPGQGGSVPGGEVPYLRQAARVGDREPRGGVPLWRAAVRAGQLQAPFHVTHVDAHADVGLGDAGYTTSSPMSCTARWMSGTHPKSWRLGSATGTGG